MGVIRERRYDNGLTLLVEELDRPVVAGHLLMPGGSAVDPAGGEGAGTLVASLVKRGAGGKSSRELAEAFDALGCRRGVGAGQSAVSATVIGLATAWPEAFCLTADMIREPALPAEEVEPCRQLALQTLAGLDDEPAHKLVIELTRRYFPGDFGRCHLGTEAALRGLDHAALTEHWRHTYLPDGAILAVAGGIGFDQVVELVESRFGDWSGAPPAPPPADSRGRVAYEHVTQTTEQVHLGIAYETVPPGHADRYHALLAVQVLSGGMGSRLFTEVREKRGLCYSVHARGHSVPGHGYVFATAGTTTERSSETLAVILGELRRLPGSVDADELARGRVRLLSSLVMSDEQTASRAARMATDQHLLGRVRPIEEIRAGVEAVTVDSLNQHLTARPPADFTVVTLGTGFQWPEGLTL